jgi:pimeloyl-ACP methyl ester carboxylesterase
MLVDLVHVKAADGVRLDGTIVAPGEDATRSSTVDALLCLHGTGSNFYGSTLFDALAPRLLDAGFAVARVNTRGHDLAFTSYPAGKARRLGSAYELVNECPLDLRAWLDLLVQRGHRRIGLVGHSLGAVKAIYSQAHDPHSAVACLVAISPPRLSYRWFRETAHSAELFSLLTMAQQHVDRGQGHTIMDVNFPLPQIITAAGFIDKYGQDENYNILRFTGGISSPKLFTFGELELELAAFAGLPDALTTLEPSAGPLDVATIATANHQYIGCAAPLATRIVEFLGGV